MYQSIEEVKHLNVKQVLTALSTAESITDLDERLFQLILKKMTKKVYIGSLSVVCGMVYNDDYIEPPISIQQFCKKLLEKK